jgi:broad specificity phosphatase PhoE
MESAVGELPRTIEKSDIDPSPPEIGGTKIVLQRHGKYERSTDSTSVGSLTEKGVEDAYALGKEFFGTLFDSIPEQERKNVDVLVIASDTQYERGGYRSMETADQIIRVVKEEIQARSLGESQLLNTSTNIHGNGGPRPTPHLREPQMLNNSPEFVEFLKEKYGDKTLKFWIAFEEDTEKATREKMGAEGPEEITDRTELMIEVLARYSKFYHEKHPEKRLIIWAATHYDTISPFVRREIFKTGKNTPLGVDYGAGISINLDKNNKGKTVINGKGYDIPKE